MSRSLAAALVTLVAAPVLAAEWKPGAYVSESTLELRTTAPGEGDHWFPVWLVVLDDQVYVRLGTRAAGRIERNTTKPYVDVRVAGQRADHVKAVAAPESVERVARARADKYWSHVVVRHMDHRLTMRLAPEG